MSLWGTVRKVVAVENTADQCFVLGLAQDEVTMVADELHLEISSEAAQALALRGQVVGLRLAVSPEDVRDLRAGLTRILTYGNPQHRPRRIELLAP